MNCVIKARGITYIVKDCVGGEDDIIWGYKIVIFQSRAWVKKRQGTQFLDTDSN